MLYWIKRKTPASPNNPTCFLYLEPKAKAQSSNRYNLYF